MQNKTQPIWPQATRRRCDKNCLRHDRKGAILVWFALMLIMLLGMTGLVIDAGLLMAAQRQAQNAADAAALAAATDMMLGRKSTAEATAIAFVTQHNGLSDASTTVNIPPGPGSHYTGARYVEVIVTRPVENFLIHILPGVSSSQTVSARAVAGYEPVSAGEGVAVLDPDARPGIAVSGGGALTVEGRVIDNSEGGGVDENNIPVNNGNNGVAASGSNSPGPLTGIFAKDIRVVGGVDKPANFKNYDPNDTSNVLHCKQLPIADPLIDLATPAVADGPGLAGGVDDHNHGTVATTNTNLKFNDPTTDLTIKNRIVSVNGVDTLILHPGIYESISIEGGNVKFLPGIFVLSPQKTTTNTLKITGGTVTAEGIMFYNTGNSYSPQNGTPDVNDFNQKPPQQTGDLGDSTQFWGSVQMTAEMKLSPLDHHSSNPDVKYPSYPNGPNPSEAFDGMLFYQRRRNNSPLNISGNSSAGVLSGTLYAKWSKVEISGQGTYDAQFVVGRIAIPGQGKVTVHYAGKNTGKVSNVFLVE